ncbi:MAG: hypothetical protein AAGD33_01895 [Actinomycetota bacterium]
MVGDIVLFAAGLALVVGIMLSAMRTVVLPHSGSVRLTRAVFAATRHAIQLYGRLDRSSRRQHYVLQILLASALLSLPLIWLSIAVVGFTMMFQSLGTDDWRSSYDLAGSAMFTLGFAKPQDLPRLTLSFAGAGLTISILALLLVTYLPTIYSAYSERETRLTSFETIAGDPPNVVGMIIRIHELSSLDRLDVLWDGWREWFASLRESHTALPAVAFLGSSRPDRNWVSTVGTLLDAAAVSLAVIDHEGSPDAALCIRSGTLALRDVAEYFGFEVEHDPAPDDPISVDRARWDLAYDELEAAGVPLVEREAAWVAWRGWRVNYDRSLIDLARLTASPASRFDAVGSATA